MKKHIETLLNQVIENLKEKGIIGSTVFPLFKVAYSQKHRYGDFTTNLALVMGKTTGYKPRVLAKEIVNALLPSPYITKVEIAGSGFINFYITESSYQNIISSILGEGTHYAKSQIGLGKSVHIEYVSANPTGPLHVGHGRGAAYGACVSNLLKTVGYKVHQEYYINDSGRQMEILILSVWIRYLQQYEEKTFFLPTGAYQGQYIVDIANKLKNRYGSRFFYPKKEIDNCLSVVTSAKNNPDDYLDIWMSIQKDLLKEDCTTVFDTAVNYILEDIKNDLEEFGVVYDKWFSESQLIKKGLMKETLNLLSQRGYVYEKNDAQWFRSTKFGDEKDRVLIRRNGVPTYFAADIAYHLYKFKQGHDIVIDIFGADHHGYIPRLSAFLHTFGKSSFKLRTLLMQFVILYRGDKKISMSTRSGDFITLRELRNEIGNDAARFFYIIRKPDQHLDFDLELAKSQSSKNPVYYVQYAHARICRIFQKLYESKRKWNCTEGTTNANLLSSSYEKELLVTLFRYSETIKDAAVRQSPHLLAHYLQTLANQFHVYYNAKQFLVQDSKLRNARLNMIAAVRQIIVNGLTLLGVSAPEEM
ncbi:arginine--tRNA ligase [Coxiella endosymbiont of Amblyomma americanum]|uniref:arginine--tRNA ligase n=1 Tax=Coxiella endosymbiont of Amblyomma americanum TaxID=325775 RepID=UPI00057E8270|nr:arginine--tRNA ligase [Coxiella endosymbiont of Amblyomma americanum]AJC50334.1 arginine--tRNA ligase [Coxiella endosymbiont of Amblyomma americanum]AUJ58680.1 arginine--tRNA ligase [Coxiella-like endosymbiont of Amblyomma americanum]